MALQLTETTPQGFAATDAYHCITNVHGTPTKMRVDVCSFPDRQAKLDGKEPYANRRFKFALDMSGANEAKNLYQYLYALLVAETVQHGGPFQTATNVLESGQNT